ncbi:MAG: hypothetical protein H0U87_06975 [Acidobacteria bacterium]|jgi:cyanophycinase-like exopeptidase|nr:hypothetical protein [Acidobacteriota bacterium]
MSEPREPRRAIAPDEWEKFLREFSERNKNRRARFDIFFASGETVEEAEEGRLESISLNKNGGNAEIVVVRADNTEGEKETMTDTLENARGVVVQYETDGSENALEITDAKNTLFSLRLESKLDGNS